MHHAASHPDHTLIGVGILLIFVGGVSLMTEKTYLRGFSERREDPLGYWVGTISYLVFGLTFLILGFIP